MGYCRRKVSETYHNLSKEIFSVGHCKSPKDYINLLWI